MNQKVRGFVESGADTLLQMAHHALSIGFAYTKGKFLSTMIVPRFTVQGDTLMEMLPLDRCPRSRLVWGSVAENPNPQIGATVAPLIPGAATVRKTGGRDIALPSNPTPSIHPTSLLTPEDGLRVIGDPDAPVTLKVGGRVYWVRMESRMVGDNEEQNILVETLGRGESVWQPLVEEITRRVEAPNDFVKIYTNRGAFWDELNTVALRDPTTVVLDSPTTEEILADIDNFVANKSRYKRTGTPWRRGYLLTGIKGAGKTSLVLVMASHIRGNIYVINAEGLRDEDLIYLFAKVPANSIILLEDVDVIPGLTTARPGDDMPEGVDMIMESTSKVSLHTLLNLLDGFYARAGVFVVMTTNRPEVLDPTLLRKGRMDYPVEFSTMTRRQVVGLWELHYPTDQISQKLVEEVYSLNWVTSTLQGVLQRNPDDPVGAEAEIWRILQNPTDQE
jgi:hypothetical protein